MAFYDTAAWKRLRRAKIATDPLCEDCLKINRIVATAAVDHKVPISAGGDPLPPLDGLRSLCWACHSKKTARGVEAGAARSDRPLKGCDADGNPLDDNHPWST